ncbi:MAG: hypothetical protein ACMG6H_04880 [Acidobacteriota bacterium]
MTATAALTGGAYLVQRWAAECFFGKEFRVRDASGFAALGMTVSDSRIGALGSTGHRAAVSNLYRLVAPQGQVIRGRAYNESSTGPDAITATRRSFVAPTMKDPTIGFRLVRTGQ